MFLPAYIPEKADQYDGRTSSISELTTRSTTSSVTGGVGTVGRLPVGPVVYRIGQCRVLQTKSSIREARRAAPRRAVSLCGRIHREFTVENAFLVAANSWSRQCYGLFIFCGYLV